MRYEDLERLQDVYEQAEELLHDIEEWEARRYKVVTRGDDLEAVQRLMAARKRMELEALLKEHGIDSPEPGRVAPENWGSSTFGAPDA